MVDRFERFSLAISRISRCWHKLTAEEMEKYGLKGAHATYLLTLSRNPDGLTAAQLSELIGKDKADVSRMLAIMEKKGLVCRQGSAYRARLRLTDEGMQAAEFVRQRASLAVELAGQGISPKEREIFYTSLETIVTNLQSISKDGLPCRSPESI